MDKLLPVILAPVLLLLSGVSGHLLLQLFRADAKVPLWERVVPWISMMVGAIAIGLLIYIAGTIGLLSRSFVLLVLLAQCMLLPFSKKFFILLCRSVQDGVSHSDSLMEKGVYTLVTLSFFYFIVTGLAASIVPNFEPDSATSYLNATKLFLQHNKIIDVGHFIGNMGKGGFMLQAYAMAIDSANLAHAWIFLLSAVGIWLLFLIILKIGGYSQGAILLLVLLSSNFAFDWYIVPAKFDGLVFALSASIISLLYIAHIHAARSGLLAVAALINGFLASVSYNNLLVSLLFFIWIFWLALRQRLGATHFLALLGMAMLGASPTYLENIILFDNPLYPFAADIFGSGLGKNIPSDGFAYIYMQELQREFSVPLTQSPILSMKLFFADYHAEIQNRFDPGLGVILIGSLLAAFLLLSLNGRRTTQVFSPDEVSLKWFSLACALSWWMTFLAWAGTQHLMRYLSAALPFAFVVFSISTRVFSSHLAPYIRTMAGLPVFFTRFALCVVVLGLVIVPLNKEHFAKFRVAKDWVSTDQDLNGYVAENFVYGGNFRFGEAIVEIGKKLKAGDKVLSFITGNYYFPASVRVFSGNGSNTLPSPFAMSKPLSRYHNVYEWEEDLKRQGFCCVVIHPDYLYLSDAEKPVIFEFMETRVVNASFSGVRLYFLR